MNKLEALLAYVQEDGRICPQPMQWKKLWEMLPDRQRDGSGWNPPLPLILGAWWEATRLEKALLLREHIVYAASHGEIDNVDTFLRRLPPDHWHLS